MHMVLKLNATYEPLEIVSWKDAITMLVAGKVEVIEEYDEYVHTVNFGIRIPAVIRLLYFVKQKIRRRRIKCCKANIFARDNYTCQYCGKKLHAFDLTIDHVVPKSRGGKFEWENVVTCCQECNSIKGFNTLDEVRMKLIKEPKEPLWLSYFRFCIKTKAPSAWSNYLFYAI